MNEYANGEIEEARKNILKIMKPILPFNQEMMKKDCNIRKIVRNGSVIYYKKCEICGEKYYCNAAMECPH